jgi:hydroxypyruvate reductase
MIRSAAQLRSDAIRIWRAGLEAVGSERLIREQVHVDGHWLAICAESGAEPVDLRRVRRIAVVGAGKAGAGMAAALEEVLGTKIIEEKKLVGWVNVPADCVRPLARIHLHAARPAGVNEPTAEGVAGSLEILRIVESLSADDLCICLISGGGSALLPAPPPEITLADKLAVTRHLSAAGADITELNTVRKQLSRIKGGGLLRACRAGRLISLIISDVLGDPLDLIASGPTADDRSTPAEALAILAKFDPGQTAIPAAVYEYLRRKSQNSVPPASTRLRAENHILANNATAVDAAGIEAVQLGYAHAMTAATRPQGQVEPIGRHLADMGIGMRNSPGPDCLISGGEGVVRLVDSSRRGLGGRNQQLALAALIELAKHGSSGIALVSAGTDGEDGPTDAAGAIVDADGIARARQLNLNAEDYLQRNDAYRFFESIDGLLKTGPTHTNVGDLRVVVVSRDDSQ